MDTFIKIASLVGVPAIISGLFALAVSRMLKKRDVKQAEIIEQNKVMEAQNKAIMLGVQAFLRDRLLQGYRHYITFCFINQYNKMFYIYFFHRPKTRCGKCISGSVTCGKTMT